MKWYYYVGTLVLAIAGYCAVFPVSTEEPVGGKTDPIITPILTDEEPLFAEIDAHGNVVRVIVADQAFIDSGAVGDPKNWIQTSSKGTIRKNYAGSGYTYDSVSDSFIPPKDVEATVFDNVKKQWDYPMTMERVLISTSTEI